MVENTVIKLDIERKIMASVAFRVANDMCDSGWVEKEPRNMSLSAKNRLSEILGVNGLEVPKLHYPLPSTSCNFWLSDNHTKRLTELAERANMSLGDAISNMLITAFLKWKEEQESARLNRISQSATSLVLDRCMQAQGKTIREEQITLTAAIDRLTSQQNTTPQIMIAEAGVGVFKTLSYLASAHEFLTRSESQESKPIVYIAVPSFDQANQVLREWAQMQSALQSDIKTMSLIGQREFVSQTAMEAFINAHEGQTGEFPEIPQEQINALKKWVNDEAPYAPDALIQHHWTVAGLLHACPDFSQEKKVSLNERKSDEDKGVLAYKTQWKNLPHNRLVICTHDMLANLTKRRLNTKASRLKTDEDLAEAIQTWQDIPHGSREQRLYEITNAIYEETGLASELNPLPNIDYLIVDEGHEFEEAFASALSKDISLNGLLHRGFKLIKEHPNVFSSIDDLKKRVALAKRPHVAFTDNVLPLKLNKEEYLYDLTIALEQFLRPKKAAGVKKTALAKSSAIYQSLLSVTRACRISIEAGESRSNGQANLGAVMHWSTEKNFPRISIGRLNCSREMNYLWMNVANKTLITSGTIYESNLVTSCETLQRSLDIPMENLIKMSPIDTQWQITPITLCMITTVNRLDGRPKFCRPKTGGPSYASERTDWLTDVSTYTVEAHKTAKGGMLVLATAFTDIADVGAIIKPLVKDTVLMHSADASPEFLRFHFLECVRNGEHPILIAAGTAWSGFDIVDDEHPDALTDLVILNAPFGMIKQSVKRMLRSSPNTRSTEISAEVLLLVRQAVGRLVRSPDTPANRRIHWLDARIHSPAMSGMLSSVKRFLARYKQKNVA
jgi:CRISPR type IV-associated DEAD/DEAH-box helicase Csf4